MIGYLLRELGLGFVAGMRSVKAYLTRGILNIWTKIRQTTQIARGTTRVMSKVTKNVSQVGQKPTQRSDFIETVSHLFAIFSRRYNNVRKKVQGLIHPSIRMKALLGGGFYGISHAARAFSRRGVAA